MWRLSAPILLLASIFSIVGARHAPPGKPKQPSCRSPEKETFTCRWEPGAEGGLPTSYALYYRLEDSERVYECPDYRTAGENSCFFNKNYTSLWVNYNITVVATNAMGTSVSDPVEVDVVYIVQPNAPENVSVVVLEDKHWPYLHVAWEKPSKADTRSGWITLNYQLRVKQEKEEDWEEFEAERQKTFNVFGLHSGGVYLVQVRCKPDHGYWSEWSEPIFVEVRDYIQRDRSTWIPISIFLTVLFIILLCTINIKRNSMKLLLLPPVPGPKIRGFDQQLLKNGQSEEVFNSLVIQGFPPTSDYDDLLVEYLEVCEDEEEQTKDLPEGGLKARHRSDSDSGRGSCDSRTLLLERCGEGVEQNQNSELEQPELSWASTESGDSQASDTGPTEITGGRTRTWPTISSPQHPIPASKPAYHSIPEIPGHASPGLSPSMQQQQRERPGEGPCAAKPPTSQRYSYAHSDLSLNRLEGKREGGGMPLPSSRSLEYVEVQRVNPENLLLVRPLGEQGRDPSDAHGAPGAEDYSKVRGVVAGNLLLLQLESSVTGRQGGVAGQEAEPCPFQQRHQATPPAAAPCKPIAMDTCVRLQEGMGLASNGYVDSAAMPSF